MCTAYFETQKPGQSPEPAIQCPKAARNATPISVADMKTGKELAQLEDIYGALWRNPLFYLDLASLVPLFVEVFAFSELSSALRLLCLLRIHRLLHIPPSHIELLYSQTIRFIRILLWMFLILHNCACMWYYILRTNGREFEVVNNGAAPGTQRCNAGARGGGGGGGG